MIRIDPIHLLVGLATIGFFCLGGEPSHGQAPAKSALASTGPAPTLPLLPGGYRKIAPGVEEIIAGQKATESVSRHDLIELLTTNPQFGERAGREGISPAKDVSFTHVVWTLEFAFKPVRFIRVDLPTGSGKAVSKLIWYLAYHVKNPTDKPVRFVPVFTLINRENGASYPDSLIPVAVPAIQRREDPRRILLDTVAIEGNIEPGHEAWGVATWDDIDPSMDRFSLIVRGLSNEYQWTDEPGAFKAGDVPGTGRKLTQKTLELNFWRPGDAYYEHEAEIRYGGAPGGVDYRWFYQ